jgi:hypothetical protein
VLSITWHRLERCWEQAETADRTLEKKSRQGRGVWALTHQVRLRWETASRAFQLYADSSPASVSKFDYSSDMHNSEPCKQM